MNSHTYIMYRELIQHLQSRQDTKSDAQVIENRLKLILVESLTLEDLMTKVITPRHLHETFTTLVSNLSELNVSDYTRQYLSSNLVQVFAVCARFDQFTVDRNPGVVVGNQPINVPRHTKPKPDKAIHTIKSVEKPPRNIGAKIPINEPLHCAVPDTTLDSILNTFRIHGLHYNVETHLSCVTSNCLFCQKLGLLLHITKCVDIPRHNRKADGSIQVCHESGMYPHLNRSYSFKLRDDHKNGKFKTNRKFISYAGVATQGPPLLPRTEQFHTVVEPSTSGVKRKKHRENSPLYQPLSPLYSEIPLTETWADICVDDNY